MPYSNSVEDGENTMSLQLHGYWRSSATYRVRIALHLKELEFEYIPVSLIKDGGEQFSTDYSQINPSQLVPTLVDLDADIQLNQSLAIIDYIDERFTSGIRLYPEHRIDKARDRALALDIATDIQPLTNLRVLNALRGNFDATETQTKAWGAHWNRLGLTAFTKKISRKAGKYCMGYDISVVDAILVPQIYNALRFDVDVENEFPLLWKIYTNCNQLEAFIKAAPENQIDAPSQ